MTFLDDLFARGDGLDDLFANGVDGMPPGDHTTDLGDGRIAAAHVEQIGDDR